MIFFRCRLQDSRVDGKGLFALEPIPPGKPVVHWPLQLGQRIVRERDLPQEISTDPSLSSTCCRIAGDAFVVSESALLDDERINHSDNPNLQYLLGTCVSLRRILPGEELTLDYRFLGSPLIREHVGPDPFFGFSCDESLKLAIVALARLFEERTPSELRPLSQSRRRRSVPVPEGEVL